MPIEFELMTIPTFEDRFGHLSGQPIAGHGQRVKVLKFAEAGGKRSYQIVQRQAQTCDNRPARVTIREVAPDSLPIARRLLGAPSIAIRPIVTACRRKHSMSTRCSCGGTLRLDLIQGDGNQHQEGKQAHLLLSVLRLHFVTAVRRSQHNAKPPLRGRSA